MAALNGGLGTGGLSNGTGSTMDALTQAYSGIQQYAAAALPSLYNQSLLTQQSLNAAGSQKEGKYVQGSGTWLSIYLASGETGGGLEEEYVSRRGGLSLFCFMGILLTSINNGE